MDKLKFEFMVKANEDVKTNTICVTTITDFDGRTFTIPDKLQPVKLHDKIVQTEIFQKVKATLQKRHEKRQVWISMNPQMKAVYCDEDGNKQFMGYLLEEQTKPQTSTTGISEESLARIIEKISEIKKDSSKSFNTGRMAEKIVIEKFNSKITNVSQWMTTFEAECARIGIEEDEKKIEIFRSVLMCLVIMVHAILPVFICNNNPRYLEQLFIIISGFLLSYNLQIYEESHEINWKILPKQTLLRWLRLTPPYALILALTSTWMRHINTGPFWHEMAVSEIRDCRKYWWQHLLYIHNYIDNTDCLVQSWYIAVDMQLFIFGLFIYLVCRTSKSRKIVLPTWFFIGIAIIAAHTYFEDLNGTVMTTPEVIRNHIRGDPTFLKVYRRSHTNIPCYILGMGAGYLFYYWQKIDLNFDKFKKYNMLCWMAGPLPLVLDCGIIVLASYFYMDAPRSSVMLRTIYAATAKPVFGLLLTVLLCAMIMKLENVFRPMLEWDWWSIVARLSYCAYTLHLTIIRYTASLSTVPFQHSTMAIVQYYFFILVVSLLLSIPLWLLVEEPMNRVWKLCLSSSSKTAQVQEKIEPELQTQSKF
ncbi:nose resistant to fluoxetine protein 6 isoform X5 [Bombyx mori]|uniref:nose resistant to fluoxetine protein 6 isoform X5 n=1 Tax=Bombyx mori TaxID=7091 RepID=UPI002ED3D87C